MQIGDNPIFQFVFTDRYGALADPTVVYAWVELPDSSVVQIDPVKISVGVYEVAFDITLSGDHFVRCEGTGNVKAAKEKRFSVAKQRVDHP